MDREEELKEQIKDLQQELVDIQKSKKEKWEKEQKEREAACGEHYYVSSGGKWTPQGLMICQWCGHEIGR